MTIDIGRPDLARDRRQTLELERLGWRVLRFWAHQVFTETEVGGCHEGFLRSDAILVVTFITDEEEDGSMGDPASWRNALVAAKGGNEEPIVVLGLLGDAGLPGTACTDGGADDAPRLREFAESFTHGSWASVCEPSYNAFFDEAVAAIDSSCSEFEPAG